MAPANPEALGGDLARFRNDLEWGTYRVDILDFVRVNPTLQPYNKTLSRVIKESAYIVVHEDLAQEITAAPKDVIGERRFGYAFLPREVEPNLFGFGPGKFGAAIKQWRFLLYMNGDVEVQIAFLVAPRSQKVLDVAGFDPVYASVTFADLASLGVFGLRETGHAARLSGALYALNTAGAAIGAILAGFVLIPAIGITGATLVGVSGSVTPAAAVWAVHRASAANQSDVARVAAAPTAPQPTIEFGLIWYTKYVMACATPGRGPLRHALSTV